MTPKNTKRAQAVGFRSMNIYGAIANHCRGCRYHTLGKQRRELLLLLYSNIATVYEMKILADAEEMENALCEVGTF